MIKVYHVLVDWQIHRNGKIYKKLHAMSGDLVNFGLEAKDGKLCESEVLFSMPSYLLASRTKYNTESSGKNVTQCVYWC